MVPAQVCKPSRGGFNKETMPSAKLLSGRSFNPRPGAIQLSSSLQVPSAFRAAAPAMELRSNKSITKSAHKPLKRKACNSLSPLSYSATISAAFHSQKLWGLLFLAPES